jgi:histidine triad (HIT) family protein
MNCIFCDKPELKTRAVLSNELAWAFLTNIPIVPGHLLICPVRCVASLDALTPEEFSAIRDLAIQLHPALCRVFGATGFNYAWNEGAVGGQNVPHFHLHMLPRKEGDSGITQYEPRSFLYRPGSRATTPEEELQEISARIRSAL